MTKQDFEATVVSNDLVRRYHVHLPHDRDSSSSFPLFIALHGRLGTGKKMIEQTRFNDIADREGFIIVYPEGFKRSWADGRGITHADKRGVDDVAFIDQLIGVLQRKFPVDHARIFVAGYSNGGFMAQRMAIERSHHFAAVAVVAASLSDWLASRFFPGRPMPALFINGTADPVTPYEGGRQPSGASILSVEDTVKTWVHFNGCKQPAEVQAIHGLGDGTHISVYTYKACKHRSQVKFFKVVGGGHVWPGETEGLSLSGAVRTGQQMDASKEIWKFFKRSIV